LLAIGVDGERGVEVRGLKGKKEGKKIPTQNGGKGEENGQGSLPRRKIQGGVHSLMIRGTKKSKKRKGRRGAVSSRKNGGKRPDGKREERGSDHLLRG